MENSVENKRSSQQSHYTHSGQSPGSGDLVIQHLPLESIVAEEALQSRVENHQETIEAYAIAIARGEQFPPVIVFDVDGQYLLADGFHRYHAHKATNKETILASVKQGTRKDAVLFSLEANNKHGLQRTNADKRKAVKLVFEDSEWSTWSNKRIAEICGVSDRFVATMRDELASSNGSLMSESATCTRNGKTYSMNTQGIRDKKKKGLAANQPSITDLENNLKVSLKGALSAFGDGTPSPAILSTLSEDLSTYREALDQSLAAY